MASPDYVFPRPSRIVTIELTHTGKVRPYTLSRNANDKVEKDPVQVAAVTASDKPVHFRVEAKSTPTAPVIISVELSNWGPHEYLFTTGFFLGMTWPFGQEHRAEGTQPGSKQIDHIDFVFETIANGRRLSWSATSGPTTQSGSVNLVDGGAGSTANVVLRTPSGSSGKAVFHDLSFDHGKREF